MTILAIVLWEVLHLRGSGDMILCFFLCLMGWKEIKISWILVSASPRKCFVMIMYSAVTNVRFDTLSESTCEFTGIAEMLSFNCRHYQPTYQPPDRVTYWIVMYKTYTTGQLRIKTVFQNNNIQDSFHAFLFIFLFWVFIKSSKFNSWGVRNIQKSTWHSRSSFQQVIITRKEVQRPSSTYY